MISKRYNAQMGDYLAKLAQAQSKPKQTNADRIRAMSDEELAKWIAIRTEGIGFDSFEDFKKGWLEWLKEEVEDD